MKSVKLFLLVTVMVLAITSTVSSTAHSEDAAEIKTHMHHVALFKNGLGFFIAEGTLPQAAGPVVMGPFPATSHGTFWIAYPADVKVESLLAKETTVKEPLDALNIAELLKANIGKKVRIYLPAYSPQEKERVIEGILTYFPKEREPIKIDPYVPGRPAVQQPYSIGPIQPQLVLIQTPTGTVAIDPFSVRNVEFPEGNISRSFDRETKAVQLHVRLETPAAGKILTASYLAKGITWAPSYIVDISDPKTARISAKAEIVNEASDLDSVDVSLVTGFPNLLFADVASPLAFKENLAEFLRSLAKGQTEVGDRRYGVTTQNVMYLGDINNPAAAMAGYGGGGYPEQPAMPAYRAAAAGQTAEDLFLYPLKSVSLKKGEVGYFPLFTESVPYKHIYQWQVRDSIVQEGYSEPRRQPELPEVVWHSLKLQNATKVPWTTASAETVQNDQILGQDSLTYTPVGGEATLRITQAVSVKAEQTELETARDRNATQFYGRRYDLVTIEGKLSVENFLDKAITLEIIKTLSGEVKSSSPEAKVEKISRGLRGVNPVSKLTWTTELGAGKRHEATYTYTVYVSI